MSPDEIERLMRVSGRDPVERDTFYNVVEHASAQP
jgi:2-iminoacetate synthase ThiH